MRYFISKWPRRITLGLVVACGVAVLAATNHRASIAQDAVTLDYGAIARQTFTQLLQQAESLVDSSAGPAEPTNHLNISAASTNSSSSPLQPFPHPAMYGGASSSGWPFVGTVDNPLSPSNAPLNTAVINAYAKFPQVILPPTPLSDGRLDIIPAFRASNPAIKVFGYTVGHVTWCPQYNGLNNYPVGYYYRDYWLAVSNGDPSCTPSGNRFLWNQASALWGPANVNLAFREQQPDGTYRYTLAEALAETMYEHAKPSRGFDGIFVDIFCPGVLWAETPTELIDYARAGYGTDNSDSANRTAFDAGWKAGHRRLAERLRELAVADGHSDLPIAANCGQGPAELQPILNGWMRENYPYQNGGSFYTNMLTYPWGYLHQERGFRSPQYNYIFTGSEPTSEPYSAYNQQKMRFGLGSASLGNGYHAFEDVSAAPVNGHYYDWWYDEYGVDLATGQAGNGLRYAGWLGQPQGEAYQMVYPDFTAKPDRLTTNQNFEMSGASPTDIPGWVGAVYSPAVGSVTRDTTTAAEGNASVHLRVDVPHNVYDYMVKIASSQTFAVTAYQQYSVTFWAKASASRYVEIQFASANAAQSLPVTTEWRRYQAVLKPTSSGSTSVQFNVGTIAGDVWVDNVHVQSGVSSVWRRDFDNGIVLLNPSDSVQTVPLEKAFQKIKGTVNPTLNDGSVVSSVTLTPNVSQGIGDGIFLLKVDRAPPAAITDLRVSGGSISFTSGRHRTTILPFGPRYRGGLFAKRISFRSPKRTVYLVAPTAGSNRDEVKLYDNRGRPLATVTPFGQSSRRGLTADVIAQPKNQRVYLAVAGRQRQPTIQLYEVTPQKLIHFSSLGIASLVPRNITLRFMRLFRNEDMLVAAIPQQPPAISVYRLNARQRPARDRSYNTAKLRYDGRRITWR
ncbi:MAG: hypothetical protein HY567_01500 [Candidatus Kerfeldbacteria bacterium]|nr:hypothetical protein [Candidatus Kerfeldbacteria bacterium]